jgi:hypothetical protein
LTSVEWWTDELHTLLGLGLGHLRGKVADLPDEGAGVVEGHFAEGRLQARDLVLLLGHDAADEAEVRLGRLVDVLVQGEAVALRQRGRP